MKRRNHLIVVLSALLALFGSASNGSADAPKPEDEKKQTTLGLYVEPAEALKWVNEKKAAIIDVRTPAEFVFVGHTGVAANIPLKFWKEEYVRKDGRTELKMIENVNFVKEVREKFKPEDTIITMCRAGQRSAEAANALAKEGFKKVYSMVGGFEGDMAKEGSNMGKRVVNGWKNSGIPWTYSLKEDIIWAPEKHIDTARP